MHARTGFRVGLPLALLAVAGSVSVGACAPDGDSGARSAAPPKLHHVLLNSINPEAATQWYLRVWPSAHRTEVAGYPAVEGNMYLLFNRVDSPPSGAWNDELHRSEPQSAFWHIGANTNTTNMREGLAAMDVTHLPLFTSTDDAQGVWRSGLVPYRGSLTVAQLAEAEVAEEREGGFSYVVGPDGVLFELSGGPQTRDSFAHVHLYHDQPQCAANWYVTHLRMELPPVRDDDTGGESPRAPYDPCAAEYGEPSWPSTEPGGTIRQPRGTVRHGNGSISFYPRQCVDGRCGEDQPLVASRGQVLDHVAFTVDDLDSWLARLRRERVTILEEPHRFGESRAFMIEGPDHLAIELVEAGGAPVPPSPTP